jgi:MFS family permease
LPDNGSKSSVIPETIVSLEVADDVKSAPGVPSLEQPVISLEPTDAVKSAPCVQPEAVIEDVAATPRAIEAAAVLDVAVAIPKRRRFHAPRLRPVHVPVKVHTFDSFQYRDFRLLWTVTVMASAGFWLQQVIVGWLAYDITKSAFITSIAMGLDALPVLLAGPIGGLLVDVFDRRKMLVFIFAYQAVVTLAFSVIVLLGYATTWHIFGFILLMGLSWVITDPARIALIPNIVPKKNLVNAFALNSMAFSITRLAAPALGGFLIAAVGTGPALFVEVGVQLGALVTALAMHVVYSPEARFRFASVYSRVVEGAKYVKGEPVLLGMMFFTATPSMMVMPFVHGLMPVYAAEVFNVGSEGLGLLLASIGVGATLGTVLVASFGDLRHKGRLVIISQLFTAAAMATFSQMPSLTLAYVMLILLSMSVMMFFATSGAVVHGIVPDNIRGRVSGLFMVTWGVTIGGSLLAGTIAERWGAPMATLLGSIIMVTILAALSLRFRAVWRV